MTAFTAGFKQGQEHGKQIMLEKIEDIKAEIEERKKNSGGEPNRELAFNICLEIINEHMSWEGEK